MGDKVFLVRVRKVMELAGWDMATLRRKLGVGVGTVNRWFSRGSEPQPLTMKRFNQVERRVFRAQEEAKRG